MILIPRTSDRIKVKIGELEFLLSPLSIEHKLKIAGLTKMDKGEERADSISMALMTIKHAVKGMTGASNMDGSAYELQFDESGSLTDECVGDLFNIPGNDKLASACVAIGNGQVNTEIDGVEIVLPKKEDVKKK
jgi:hypothetical protein